MKQTERLDAFYREYFSYKNFQQEIANFYLLKDSQEDIFFLLKDLLFFEEQIDFFTRNKLNINNFNNSKKKNIEKTEIALKKGAKYFLESEFKFNTDIFLAKTIFNWDPNMYSQLIKEKKLFKTQGEHFYLVTYSILRKEVYDIHLDGIQSLLIDLYQHNDSFTGINLLDLLKDQYGTNNKYQLHSSLSMEERVLEFLSSQTVYFNSLIIL